MQVLGSGLLWRNTEETATKVNTMEVHLPSSSTSGLILRAISEISEDSPEKDVRKYIAQPGRYEKNQKKKKKIITVVNLVSC